MKPSLMVVCLLMAPAYAVAQDHGAAPEPYRLAAPVKNLATLFTDLFGPHGLIVDSEATLPGEQSHSAHFNSDFQSNFGKFSTALVSQFVTLPLPSPAAGFTFQLDPTLGVFERTTRSFGPILAERAETIGAKRVSFGFASQRFTFDTVEGLDLNKIPSVFTHDNAELLGGRQDVVTTESSIQATVNQFTTFFTMGITDRLDVSVAVPFISNSLTVVSDATVQRLGTTNPLTHFFRQSDGSVGNARTFTAVGSASGLGDVTVRLKTTVEKKADRGLALGLDVRLPTGDQMNLLGTGTAGLTPFAAYSTTWQSFAPHVNVSYQWNGSSILAGNPATGESADFPDSVGYAVGTEVSANRRVTLAFDVIGRYVINAERLSPQTFHALDGKSTFPNIAFSSDSFNMVSGAVGFKVNAFQRLLLDANVLFALDHNGVRDRITPLVGFEYSF
ncbi:MAG: hypothetical protein DMF89_25165 [Acidobacteria bacterium]|nr:MAG: hypothetical protein DMF90_02375 [Acidobacteriota bacterium]PYR45408.1 MAG: hypothetical protein DMF89_25165 [Acidobacteriota bacterium]